MSGSLSDVSVKDIANSILRWFGPTLTWRQQLEQSRPITEDPETIPIMPVPGTADTGLTDVMNKNPITTVARKYREA